MKKLALLALVTVALSSTGEAYKNNSNSKITEKARLDRHQANIAIQCSNFDLSKIMTGGLVEDRHNPNKVLVLSPISWVDFGTNKKPRVIAALELLPNGTCVQKRVGGLTSFTHRPGSRYSSPNQNLFNCAKELSQIKNAKLDLGDPTIITQEFESHKIETTIYPIENNQGQIVKRLISISEWNSLIVDDNYWRHESCALR